MEAKRRAAERMDLERRARGLNQAALAEQKGNGRAQWVGGSNGRWQWVVAMGGGNGRWQ